MGPSIDKDTSGQVGGMWALLGILGIAAVSHCEK